MKKKNLSSRILAKPALIATTVALSASMAPVAFAAPTSAKDVADSSVTITDLHPGDTVSAWLIADADINDRNEVVYKFVNGLSEAYDTVDELVGVQSDGYTFTKGTDMQNAAAAIANSLVNTGVYAEETADADSATLTLESGYYLIRVTSTSGETKVYQNMVVDVAPQPGDNGNYKSHENQTIPVKSSDVKVTKTVGEDKADQTDNYQVGDTIPFEITSAIPSYPVDSPNAKFVIGDSPSAGLNLDLDSISVSLGGVTANEGNDYTITKNNNSFFVSFNKDFILANGGVPVTINYTAKLTKEAFSYTDGDVTNNNATVTFNPNPYTDAEATPSDGTTVQTYGYVFDKIDKNGALEGAEFTLCDANGNPIKDEDGNNIVSTSTSVNGKAYVYFAGLKAGVDYIAKETKVPAGHSAVDVNFKLDKQTAQQDNPATAETENNYFVNTTSVNDPDAPALPVTGGAGTLGMTIAGVVFIGGAAYLLVRSRRKGEE